MLSLVLCAALSQAPVKVAVVQSSNLGVAPKRTAELTRMFIDRLATELLQPVEAKLPCDNRACLVARAKELGAPGVVSVAFASLGKDTVMDLECIAADDGRSLAQTTFTVRSSDAQLSIEATTFVADVRRALAPTPPPAPPKVADAPEAPPKLTPENPPPQPEAVAQGTKTISPVSVGLGVAALAAAVASIVLVSVTVAHSSSFNSHIDGMRVDIPRAEAERLMNQTNTEATASAVCLSLTGALVAGFLATLLF